MKKLILTILLLLVVVFSFMTDFDKMSHKEIRESFEKALTVFATAKGLNAAISVAQGTEIGPVAIGQMLDPINDMIEQFSWVMIAALTSLGIQKILIYITANLAFNLALASVIFIFIVMIWFKEKIDKRYISAIAKIVVLILFVRFSVPLNSYVKHKVYENYISNTEFNIERNSQRLELSSKKIENISSKDSNSSWFKTIKNFDFSKKIEFLKQEVVSVSDYIINLIVVYIFETLFFPLVFLLFLYRLIKSSLIL